MVDLKLTEEELALLGHSELAPDEGAMPDQSEDAVTLAPAGYRERLALGDLSW
jgi:hypothetical protein